MNKLQIGVVDNSRGVKRPYDGVVVPSARGYIGRQAGTITLVRD